MLGCAALINPTFRQYVECAKFNPKTTGILKVNQKSFRYETADNENSRSLGLGDRPCIRSDQAMLFVFDKDDMTNHCFWMKDMRFSIDIVWLDNSKKVVGVAKGISPQSYPKEYCPELPTRYVLEFKNQTADKLGIAKGTVVSF